MPAISADGRRVAFSSRAQLTPSDPSVTESVYVRDVASKDTVLVSRADGLSGAGNARSPPTRRSTPTALAWRSRARGTVSLTAGPAGRTTFTSATSSPAARSSGLPPPAVVPRPARVSVRYSTTPGAASRSRPARSWRPAMPTPCATPSSRTSPAAASSCSGWPRAAERRAARATSSTSRRTVAGARRQHVLARPSGAVRRAEPVRARPPGRHDPARHAP